ncbi:MAG: hypothetical protein V3S60_07215, partial [Acidimicrobiia bacterium]
MTGVPRLEAIVALFAGAPPELRLQVGGGRACSTRQGAPIPLDLEHPYDRGDSEPRRGVLE